MLKTALAAVLAVGFCTPAYPHAKWANGDPIPAWVRTSCCGPSDAHQIDAGDVEETDQAYIVHVLGRALTVPRDKALPSQDGAYWIFFNEKVSEPLIYCFFLPMGS